MSKNVIITGSTGMVGHGVLIECLENNEIEKVLCVNRKPLNIEHPKLKEVIHKDLSDIKSIDENWSEYDACFFCLGISSLGMSEEEYTRITYDITKEWSDTLYEANSNMVFNFVSGAGTDSSESGKLMWARVKGKTENMILNKGFKDAYAFRPGFIVPEKGVKSSTSWVNFFYTILKPFMPLFKKMKLATSSSNVGKAMINTMLKPIKLKHLENRDIDNLANR